MCSEGYCSRPVCVCVCVFPRPSSATHATKRQTRHTGDLSIVFAIHFLATLEFSCYSLRYKSAILYTSRVRLYSAHARSRGAHVNLEADRVVDFSLQLPEPYSGMSMRLKKVCP